MTDLQRLKEKLISLRLKVIAQELDAIAKLSKNRLLKGLQSLREKYIKLEEKNNKLEAGVEKLKEELKKQKIKSVNKNANKPSSKQPEWDKKGVGNDGKGKKGKGRNSFAFSDLRHIIAKAALSDDFNLVCNKKQKLPRKSFVDALLRMGG